MKISSNASRPPNPPARRTTPTTVKRVTARLDCPADGVGARTEQLVSRRGRQHGDLLAGVDLLPREEPSGLGREHPDRREVGVGALQPSEERGAGGANDRGLRHAGCAIAHAAHLARNRIRIGNGERQRGATAGQSRRDAAARPPFLVLPGGLRSAATSMCLSRLPARPDCHRRLRRRLR